MVAQAGGVPGPGAGPSTGHRGCFGALCRVARPFGLQLSRRRQHSGGTGGGGGPARSACPCPDRSRRALRGGAVRRGGPGARHGHRVRCRAVTQRGQPHRRARSAGAASAGARQGSGGVSAVVAAAGARALGRWGEGRAALRLRRVDRGGGRALAHPDRLSQGTCPAGAGLGWSVGCRGRAGRPGRAVRAGPGQCRAHPPRSPARRRTQRRARRTGTPLRARRRRHHRRACRRTRSGQTRHGDGGDPGPQLDGRRRGISCAAGWFTPAVRRGDGPDLPRRRGDGCGRARRAVRVRVGADRAEAATVRRPRRSHRDQLAAAPGRRRRPGPLRPARARPPGLRPDRARAGRHRATRLSGLFPGGARHHPILPTQRHPRSGPRFGGQFGGLLRTEGHQRRPGGQRVAV